MKEGKAKRIDGNYYNDTMKQINTLKTLGIDHLAVISISVKSEDEVEEKKQEEKFAA